MKKFLNVIFAIIFSALLFLSMQLISGGTCENIKSILFIIFYISFGGVMANIYSLLNLKYIGKRFIK